MKLSTLLVFPLTLAVAGCMQGTPIKQAPVSVGLRSAAATDRVVGYSEPIIRTFVPAEISEELNSQYASNPNTKPVGVKRTEISGATCTIDTAEFTAQFQTPAIVRLPKFHGKPSKLRMTCKTPDLSTHFTQAPTLDGVILAGASVAGLVAAAVTSGIAASKDNWSYSADDFVIWVNLEEK